MWNDHWRPNSPKCRTASLPHHAFVICYEFVVKAIRDRNDEAIAELPLLGLRVRLAPSLDHSFRDAPRFLPVLRWDASMVNDYKLRQEKLR